MPLDEASSPPGYRSIDNLGEKGIGGLNSIMTVKGVSTVFFRPEAKGSGQGIC